MQYFETLANRSPKLTFAVGKGLFVFGSFLISAGLVCRAGAFAINKSRSYAKQEPLTKLSEVFPSLPTWFVPESAVGYAVATAIAVLGLYLGLRARAQLAAIKATQMADRRRR